VPCSSRFADEPFPNPCLPASQPPVPARVTQPTYDCCLPLQTGQLRSPSTEAEVDAVLPSPEPMNLSPTIASPVGL
jgi:hypothetical protein